MLPSFAFAGEFTSFAAQAMLGRDGTIGVEEHLIFDFGKSGSHGIIREIPLYVGPFDRSIATMHMLFVGDKTGTPYHYDASSGGNVGVIRIGDKDTLLTDKHYFDVRYVLNGLASEQRLRWQVMSPVSEQINAFRSDIYFPVPIPPVTATGTCAFVPDRMHHTCALQSLIKDGRLYGFRVSADKVVKEGVLMDITYPRGLIQLPVVHTIDTKQKTPIVVWYLLISVLFAGLLSLVLWYHRGRILEWIDERKKPAVLPDLYSYVARAVAAEGRVTKRAVISTIVDLSARGYLNLSPIAHPVGEFEFIDYDIEVVADTEMEGTEGVLLSLLRDSSGRSLDTILHTDFDHVAEALKLAAESEIAGIILLKSDERLPDLPGFKSERFNEK